MYRRFRFEGDVHVQLDCVPLAVRRKLDLVALKISLPGWQALPRQERLSLCHLPVDTQEDLDIYSEVFRSFCERAAVPLSPLPASDPNQWSGATLPESLRTGAGDLGFSLTAERWAKLSEEERYCVFKYFSKAKRNDEKIGKLLSELEIPKG